MRTIAMELVKGIPLNLIAVHPDAPRRDTGDVTSLAASIRERGLLSAMVAQRDPMGEGYLVTRGVRRLAALKLLEAESADLMVQAADNQGPRVDALADDAMTVRLGFIERWRAMAKLMTEGHDEGSAALSLGMTAREVKQGALLGRLHPPILDAMEKHQSIPPSSVLRRIAGATIEKQKATWKHMKPGAGGAIAWSDIGRALEVRTISRKVALFGETEAQEHGVRWDEDLFLPADDAEFTSNTLGFLRAQSQWVRDTAIPQLALHGITAHLLVPEDGAYRPATPAGHEHVWHTGEGHAEPWLVPGPPASAKLIRGLFVDGDGKVRAIWYRAMSKRALKEAERRTALIEQEQAARAAAMRASKASAPQVATAKGDKLIDEARRGAVQERLRQMEDPWVLLAATVAVLRDTCPSMVRGIADVATAAGVLDLDADDARARTRTAAIELVGALIQRPHSSYQAGTRADVVDLIGQGIDAVVTLPSTAEVLGELKKDALNRIASARRLSSEPTQKALREKIVRTLAGEALDAMHLPALAWSAGGGSDDARAAPGGTGDGAEVRACNNDGELAQE